jgi:pyruvate dehydrogenase E1 component alpha subunit
MGSYAIIGAQMCIALGAGWTSQYKKSQQVSVCFFGDGTTNIGAFHEALNMAAVWKLPVVFVCENNMYMEYTPIGSVTSVKRPAADRAAAYGLEPIVVDGNDADACYLVAETAYERARRGDGPSLIEALTDRHGGHSRADPASYRPDAEVAEWLKRDPLPMYRARLLAAGVGEAALAKIEAAADAEIDRATEEAKNGPLPSVDEIEKDTWADGTSTWRN